MISPSEGTSLIESEFPQLIVLYSKKTYATGMYGAVRRLLEFSKEAVLHYNLNMSRKCFDLAHRLYHQGDWMIRNAVEISFIASFSTFVQKDQAEKKRLKFFMPDDFYEIFVTKIDQSGDASEKPTGDPGEGLQNITVRLTTCEDVRFAKTITQEMEASAKLRGCGIAKRNPASVEKKMREGKAVIALTNTGEWVGFSYIQTWENRTFVSNSGLIVSRNIGNAVSPKRSSIRPLSCRAPVIQRLRYSVLQPV